MTALLQDRDTDTDTDTDTYLQVKKTHKDTDTDTDTYLEVQTLTVHQNGARPSLGASQTDMACGPLNEGR